MFTENREYQVKDVATVEELAELLDEHSWTLCTGFRINGYLWLNDATSENGAQEYAVYKGNTQIESITAS